MRKIRSVKLPYVTQVYVYAICRNIDSESEERQELVRQTLKDAAKGDEFLLNALEEVMYKGRLPDMVARENYVRAERLYTARRYCYETIGGVLKSGGGVK